MKASSAYLGLLSSTNLAAYRTDISGRRTTRTLNQPTDCGRYVLRHALAIGRVSRQLEVGSASIVDFLISRDRLSLAAMLLLLAARTLIMLAQSSSGA